MTSRLRRLLAAGVGSLLLAAPLIGGCNADTKLTEEEKSNINGTGQMPPEAQAEMARRMQQSQQRREQSQQQPGAPGPAQPPGPAGGQGR